MEKKTNKPKYTIHTVDITIIDVKAENRQTTLGNIINDTDDPLMDTGQMFFIESEFGPAISKE